MSRVDWLSHLLQMMTITGQMEVRCVYGAPWRVAWAQSAGHEIPYHVVLKGRATIEDAETGKTRELVRGDIVLLPHGAAHVLQDGSRRPPARTCNRQGSAGGMLSENDGQGEQVDLLCGRIFVGPPHDRLIRHFLPTHLVVRAMASEREEGVASASSRLACLVLLMSTESAGEKPGGYTVLNALSSALFTLVLRTAIESGQSPAGLLALAGHPRLAPALSAMFADPGRPWGLRDLAALCSMSRTTFMRHFHETLGQSAIELLTDIRMSLAANALKMPATTTETVANSVGYRSVAAFGRMFTDRIGTTPGQWRRLAHKAPSS